jgi:para-aminobenzoate synthetase component 1
MASIPIIGRKISSLFEVKAQSVFERVQHMPWAMLLDTCNNKLSDGRYDILVHSPVASYQFKNAKESLLIHDQSFNYLKDLSDHSSPFDKLATLHQAFTHHFNISALKDHRMPFLMGVLGLFGYDINILTDRIIDSEAQQYKLDDIAVGFYQQSLIFDNYTGEVYHFAPEGSDDDWLNALVRTPQAQADNNQASFNLVSEWQSNVSEAEYLSRMAQIEQYLHAGDCYQVNFAQRFSAPYRGCEWEAYKMLTKVNKAPFSSFIRLPESCVLSVSPERFLLIKDGHVVTKPIKGTRKRAKDPIADKALSDELLKSEKDRAENLMIVDLLRNDLSKHCQAHSVKVPHLFALESYPAVHHMVSTVIGELKESSGPFDLFAGAFPGGSITGAPKVRAMQIIQELEPDKRSIYCGSIGYVGVRNDMDTSICIRTILAENGTMHCWAGGGIVLDSQAQEEYQESFDKVAKILPVLAETISSTDNPSASVPEQNTSHASSIASAPIKREAS